jgi:hypothetical protein
MYVYRVSVRERVILGIDSSTLQVAQGVTMIAGSTTDWARRDLDFLKSVCNEVGEVHQVVLQIPR